MIPGTALLAMEGYHRANMRGIPVEILISTR